MMNSLARWLGRSLVLLFLLLLLRCSRATAPPSPGHREAGGDGGDDPSSLRGRERKLDVGRVTGFELYDTSGLFPRKVLDLEEGSVVNLEALGLRESRLTIKALTTDVGSVQFGFDGDPNVNIENSSPYFLCGGWFFGWLVFACEDELTLGQHTITATPYSASGASSESGAALTVTFSIVQSVNPDMRGDPEMCGVPLFVGGWEPAKQMPKPLAEAQGGVIGNYFFVTCGFDTGFFQTTTDTYRRDLSKPDAEWEKQDDYPLDEGVTHGATVVIGDKFYICGGYLGGHPGPHIPNCFVFDNSVAPGQGQWTALPDMPDGRGGGGLTYDSTLNKITYAGGAERPNADKEWYFTAVYTVDYLHAWSLDLGDPEAVWQVEPDIPYFGNHMGFVTALDKDSNEHHFYLGGQVGDLEYTGNVDNNYEWDAMSAEWIEKAPLPFARGHASESTRPISCGFFQAGGSFNDYGVTREVTYYDTGTNSWVKIGDLPVPVRTPVCDVYGEYMECQSGLPDSAFFAWKRKIIVP